MTTVSSASPALKENDPKNRLFGPLPDVQAEAGYEPDHPARVGFFTDTSVCIGCKACEVACKEWNTLPMDDSHGKLDALGLSGMSYDNTGQLGEHLAARGLHRAGPHGRPAMPGVGLPGARQETPGPGRRHARAGQPGQGAVERAQRRGAGGVRPADRAVGRPGDPLADVLGRLQAPHARRLLDACPTGALFRSEFGTVVVQQDICNGCGYCVPPARTG